MTPGDATAQQSAAILNAAYMVRYFSRPCQRAQRAAAIQTLAGITRAALEAPADAEGVLYALAVGLYQRGDARFQA